MSDIEFDCPHCEQHLAVEEEVAGMIISCPTCQKQIQIPHPPQDASPAAPSPAIPPSPPPAPEPKLKDCPFCGEQILKKAIKCKYCGSMLEGSETASRAAPAPDLEKITQQLLLQNKFNLVQGENVLIEGLSTYIKSAINAISCHAFLTNYRLIFCNKGMVGAQAVFGVIGAAAAFARKPTKITFQVPLSQIASITKGKHLFATKYTVCTKSGQRYNLQFTKQDKWESAFMSLGVSMTR